jgi:bacillopeptidase F (M6 metalloprotease family)
MRVGIPPGQAGGGAITYSSISQTVALPAGSTATLRYWIYPIYQDDDDEDLQYVWLVDAAGTTQVLATSRDDGWGWDEHTLVLSAFAGQTIRLHFSVKNDGDSDVATIYLDDVRLEVCPP